MSQYTSFSRTFPKGRGWGGGGAEFGRLECKKEWRDYALAFLQPKDMSRSGTKSKQIYAAEHQYWSVCFYLPLWDKQKERRKLTFGL